MEVLDPLAGVAGDLAQGVEGMREDAGQNLQGIVGGARRDVALSLEHKN
jgi:hypothetical protein